MDVELPISLAFLDTSIYIATNYGFAGPLFSALKARITSKQVRLGITKITISEVESNIRQGVVEAELAIEKTKNKARILRNSKDIRLASLFEPWDKELVIDELIRRFHDFLSEFSVEILDYEDVDIEKVFALYFNRKAPFGDGKKKDEFPDAFVMEILEGWGIAEDSSVYSVSTDKDFSNDENEFKRLEHVASLADLLSKLSFKYEELAPLCALAYEHAREAIDSLIIDRFTNTGFYIEDQKFH